MKSPSDGAHSSRAPDSAEAGRAGPHFVHETLQSWAAVYSNGSNTFEELQM